MFYNGFILLGVFGDSHGLKCVSSIFTYFFMIHIAKLIAVTEKTMSRNEENGRKS